MKCVLLQPNEDMFIQRGWEEKKDSILYKNARNFNSKLVFSGVGKTFGII